jgi:hypothetical protein
MNEPHKRRKIPSLPPDQREQISLAFESMGGPISRTQNSNGMSLSVNELGSEVRKSWMWSGRGGTGEPVRTGTEYEMSFGRDGERGNGLGGSNMLIRSHRTARECLLPRAESNAVP